MPRCPQAVAPEGRKDMTTNQTGLPRLRDSLARRWGIAPASEPLQWLLRLFVLAPHEARPWPGWLERGVAATARMLARGLGVRHPGQPGEWLLRLLLLPPQDARVQTWIPPWLASALRWLMRLIGLPLRVLSQMLDRFRYDGSASRLEGLADRLERLPLFLRGLILALASALFWMAATTPLTGLQQLVFFLLLWLTALIVRRMPGQVATLLLIGLALTATGRYVWWRLTETLDFQSLPEYLFGYGLVLAEAYTWVVTLLGFIQNARPLQRRAAALPEDPAAWPTVDVFIPTYNEPLDVVKPTLYAALALDWPRDKLRVWLLDDGRRSAFRDFCASIGAGYMTRDDNAHAKAGNLNRALKKTDGELVAIFDCDHVPVRSFLKKTVGWFLQDPTCAMLQTPHHFFSPDPFERNLGTFGRVPNEGSLFYGVVQDGNDLWNATFFCGSCAVLRRAPLEEVGGIAVETVTEDAHTALRMHRLGYTTAYLNEVQAAGLATESLSGHIGQRIRWARGMAQIFRVDNPLFGPGLKLFQRLCYSNAMLHFFNGIPRLVFLTAPLAYLYFGLHVIYAAASAIAVYALPHLILSELANARVQSSHRHSFWAELYETVLAWYITLPTTVAFFRPSHGKFNVTAKGGLIEESYFDAGIAKPYLILIALNFGGLGFGLWRLLYGDPADLGTVVLTLAWALYNLTILGAALGVARETRQVRSAHRVPVRVRAAVQVDDSEIWGGHTTDFSMTGLGLRLPDFPALPPGTPVKVLLPDGDHSEVFPARLRQSRDGQVSIQFDPLTPEREAALVRCTFSRPDLWIDWSAKRESEGSLKSLRQILLFGLRGYTGLLDRAAAALERWLRERLTRQTTETP